MGKMKVTDKGGRRMGIDRRQVSISKGDERREHKGRRSGKDRRKEWTFDENDPNERRSLFNIE